MKLYPLISILTVFLLPACPQLLAVQADPPSVISLKSCKLDIRADQISHHDYGTSYTGNVQFLYGLANVKTNSVTLVKKKDGSCHLIAQFCNAKNAH